MRTPNPTLHDDAPIQVISSRVLFRSGSVRHRNCGSLIRLESGRLLLAFRLGTNPERRNDEAIMITYSDDHGTTWDEPVPIYVHPGWDCLPMGGLFRFTDHSIFLMTGRVKVDITLGGDEPFSDWYVAGVQSVDGGRTWLEPGPEIRIFPYWTELYGASNPHLLADGRFMLAVMGTTERDDGWEAGVAFTDAACSAFSLPVIFAAAAGRNFSDVDIVRLPDGRFLAVVREMVTRDSFYTLSADDGQTWSPIQPTGFKGANIKLLALRSGAILCAYRDEDPSRPGVSCSVSADGGHVWEFVGQLYAADPLDSRTPGALCGYPDLVYLGPHEIACVLHTYPDAEGHVDLHFLRLSQP